MKKPTYVFLLAIVLSACAFQTSEIQSITTSLTSEPTSIAISTATLNLKATETARWEEERFRALVPETLDGAMENNRIYFESFREDFSRYVGKIREGLDESEEGSEYYTAIFSGFPGEMSRPGGWGLNIDEAEIKGVGALVMPNGDELVLLTYLLGRDDYGPERALVTLCVDPDATRNYLESAGLNSEVITMANLEENYSRIIGQKSDVSAGMIIGFFEGQERGNWSNLYDVYDAQPILHTDAEERGLHLRFLSPAMQELEGRSDQATEMENMVIPVITIFFPNR